MVLAPGPPASAKDIYGALHTAGQSFLRIFSTSTRWILPVLYEVCETLWAQARITDAEACHEEAARFVNKAFTICITDRNLDVADSRKYGTCRIAGFLFRIYFYVHCLDESRSYFFCLAWSIESV